MTALSYLPAVLSTKTEITKTEILPTDSYKEALRKVKKICQEHGFLNQVLKCSDLFFWKAFEHGRAIVPTIEFEKKLFSFYWTNQEETGMSEQSRIAHDLFLEIAKRHTALGIIIERRIKSIDISND